ncbi:acyltransferase family protein [Microterricola viridarii]|uniref:acyltransferase family protein n=1 Tax=Microterricola viridarii TaxID=412690 RepID=UPI000B1BDA53|nr:acyltransferase [Microterricola viridarii]
MTLAPARARTVHPAPRRAPAAATPAAAPRDRSIDAVRTLLLLVVVALHSTMVGVSVGAAGPVLQNALEEQAWFAPVSWVLQVMPLFFVIGGFASVTQWRRLRATGVSAPAYVRGRIDRLVRPAIVLVAVVGAVLLGMLAVGVPAELVATASFRIGQPLWFLAVYILCSALVPLMVAAHERARRTTPAVLATAVIAVDAVRFATGSDAVGFLNLLFVWLLVQQLGFWLADGAVEALPRRTRIALIPASLATLVVLCSAGPYSPDMYVNLNPPTVALVLLGVAQLMVFSLLRGRIAHAAERPVVHRVVQALGQRSMTVYIWHMPVLIALAAVLLALNAVAGLPLPDPLSAAWWATRPAWLFLVAVAVTPVVAVLARFERGKRTPQGAAPSASVAVDTVLGAGGVATVLVAGFGVLPASIGLLLLGWALIGTARVARAAGVIRRKRTESSAWMTQQGLPADDSALPVS